MSALLEVDNVAVQYGRGRRAVTAVHGVSLSVSERETVGLVGESGSGKSTVARAILGLARISAGRVSFDGREVTALSWRRRREYAGQLQVVFQDPHSSLNEAKSVGKILTEAVIYRGLDKRKAYARAEDLVALVGLDPDTLGRLPKSFSGGQKQRIAIARALMSEPKLIVCDEPTSSLDISVQAQIINLLRKVQHERGVAYLFIAHDLSLVRVISTQIAVMKDGEIVEAGATKEVYEHPREDYTKRLLAAEPYPDPVVQRKRRAEWERLGGTPVDTSLPSVGTGDGATTGGT